MRAKILILSLLTLTVAFTACKKDEVEPKDENNLKIEGNWQIESMNFLDDIVLWNDDIEFNVQNYMGWSPAMFQKMWGMDFQTTKTEDKEGYRLVYKEDWGYFNNPEKDYWYWNHKDDGNSFEVQQINTQMPPIDFSIKQVKNIEILNDGKEIRFGATVKSRISGESLAEATSVNIEMILKKKTPSYEPEILFKGEPFPMEDLD